MYTIGDISRIVNVSANTLRYYDEIGILKPCLVQASNQYRYYSASQVKDIIFILELKQYGFSLEEIKVILQDKSNKKLKPMMEEKLVELRNEIAVLKERYTLLEKRISNIGEKDQLKMGKGKVLIVDDFALARIMIGSIIEEYGYTVAGEASNGEEAIEAYDVLKPDIVIMDIIMPKMDGIDAALKIMDKYKNARIIMCSAMSQASVIQESIKTGARGFASKPISSLKLIEALEKSFDDNYDFKADRFNNVNSTNEHEHFSGPLPVEQKTITYLEDKFSELSQKFSYYFLKQFNSQCTFKLIAAENITMSEFRTLLTIDNYIGAIKYNISDLPIHVFTSGAFGNKKELLREFIDFTAKNLREISSDVNSTDVSMSVDAYESINESYSTILISLDIELANENKGFVMLSLPHDFLKYLPK